jgi:histone acetyltransferase
MEVKVERDEYKSRKEFIRDAQLIFDNCRTYNGEGTTYYKCANRLEAHFYEKLKEWPEEEES